MTRRGLVLIFLLISACSDLDQADDVSRVLAAARERLGGDEVVSAFETVRTVANVDGPRSDFATGIWSARDGRVRMEQSGGLAAGADPTGNWLVDPESGSLVPLPDPVLAFIRGHELHAVVLAPQSRYDSLTVLETTTFAGTDAVAIQMKSPLDADAIAYYAVADSMPLGFRMLAPDPDVIVTLGGWDERDGLLVFTSAVFTHGEDRFVYDYVEVSFKVLADSVFRAPVSTGGWY